MALKKKAKKAVKRTSNTITEGATGFIALTRAWEGDSWYLSGNDVHKTSDKARDCVCADNDPENVAVLEVKIVAFHKASLSFVKQDKIDLKYND